MREGKEHPQGPAAALPALGGCRQWAAPLGRVPWRLPLCWELPCRTRVCWGCRSKERSSRRAWESCKGSSSTWQHPFPPPSHWCSFESCCLQCGTSSGNVFPRHCLSFCFFIDCSLSGTSLLSPLVPQVSVGCSLNPFSVYLLSVVDLYLCLLCAVMLGPLIFQPRPAFFEALTSL